MPVVVISLTSKILGRLEMVMGIMCPQKTEWPKRLFLADEDFPANQMLFL